MCYSMHFFLSNLDKFFKISYLVECNLIRSVLLHKNVCCKPYFFFSGSSQEEVTMHVRVPKLVFIDQYMQFNSSMTFLEVLFHFILPGPT